MHPADDALERRAVVRRRQAAAKNMAVDVELVVLDPAWVVDIERRLLQAGFEERRDVQSLGDHRLELLEKVALVILGQAEDRILPTCIGISGVSRYRNDASSDDSFLASPM